jgi:hypothetical protein
MGKKSKFNNSFASILLIVFVELSLIGLVYGYIDIDALYYPTLNVGGQLDFNSNYRNECHSPPSCIRISSPDRDATIIWRYPDGNTGTQSGRDLTGARKIKFYAKGQNLADPNSPLPVKFTIGAFGGDTANIQRSLTLTSEWELYEMDIPTDKNLHNIAAGFACTIPSAGVVYLDDIVFEY